ncbi:MAG: hypothetical protein ACPG32_02825 [Akkermansiaceae bacterium]
MLFWIVLGISALVAGIFASIGFDEQGYSLLFGLWNIESSLVNTKSGFAEMFYLVVFTNIVVTWWLAYLAIALALVSCNSIFPQFLSAGSVDVAVSKPIGRVKLFLTKYMGSLLFVFLQVGLFCLIVFLAMGVRLGSWNWSIFWAVPILVFVFSMIYCVGVLVAVLTRSSMLSLLSMLLLWGAALLVQWSENALYNMSYAAEESGVKMDVNTGELVSNEGVDYEGWKKAHRVSKAIAWPLPKTREVTLMIKQKIKTGSKDESLAGVSLLAFASEDLMESQQAGGAQKVANRHSSFYILGSSALFELVVLGFACWRFSRKDY